MASVIREELYALLEGLAPGGAAALVDVLEPYVIAKLAKHRVGAGMNVSRNEGASIERVGDSVLVTLDGGAQLLFHDRSDAHTFGRNLVLAATVAGDVLDDLEQMGEG